MQDKMTRWPIIAGSLAGLAVWVYDYDFFLNAGGPETPISTAILRLSHLEHANVLLVVLWPLCVLLGVGALVGFLMSQLKV
jgi:hypothetical protein